MKNSARVRWSVKHGAWEWVCFKCTYESQRWWQPHDRELAAMDAAEHVCDPADVHETRLRGRA